MFQLSLSFYTFVDLGLSLCVAETWACGHRRRLYPLSLSVSVLVDLFVSMQNNRHQIFLPFYKEQSGDSGMAGGQPRFQWPCIYGMCSVCVCPHRDTDKWHAITSLPVLWLRPPLWQSRQSCKRPDCVSWEVCIPPADSLNYPVLVRSQHGGRFVYGAQSAHVIQCHRLLLLHAHAIHPGERCMRFVFMHSVFSISKSSGHGATANTLLLLT